MTVEEAVLDERRKWVEYLVEECEWPIEAALMAANRVKNREVVHDNQIPIGGD